MEQDLITIAKIASPSVAVIFITWKILIPLTNLLIAKMNGTDMDAHRRLTKIEDNDLHDIEDIRGRLSGIEQQVANYVAFQLDVQKQFGHIISRLST